MNFKNVISWPKRHKVLTVICIAAVAFGIYEYNTSQSKKAVSVKYSIGSMEKATILTTVSGSGQVAASNQVDVTAKIETDVKSEVKSIKVKVGDEVKEGDVLAVLDSKNLAKKAKQAQNSLAIAQNNLAVKLAGATKEDIEISRNGVASAKLSYDDAVKNIDNVKYDNEQSLKKAQMSIDNAKINLDNAQRSYDNAATSKTLNNSSDSESLKSAYDAAMISANSAYLTIRSTVVSADTILAIDNKDNDKYSNLFGAKDSQTLIDARSDYDAAKTAMTTLQNAYDQANTRDKQEALLTTATQSLQTAKKLAHDTYSMLVNSVSGGDLSQNTLDNFKQSMSSQENSVVSAINSIQNAKQKITDTKLSNDSSGLNSGSSVSSAANALTTAKNNYQSALDAMSQTIEDNKQSLQKAESDAASKLNSWENAKTQHEQKVAAPRDIDIANLKLQISQAQEDYGEALDNLANAEIKAPIDGVIAKIIKRKGEAITTSDSVLTLITKQQLAEITLNEVDVAKVKVGQKATLTFSAIDGLNVTGEVAEVDRVGTNSQGVVSYPAKIAFDVQDDRIRPPMSISAVITIERHDNVDSLPNAAIKTDSSSLSYVEVFSSDVSTDASGYVEGKIPEKKYVQIGLAGDERTEITGGISAGDKIVLETISSSSSSSGTTNKSGSSNSGLRMFTGGGGPR